VSLDKAGFAEFYRACRDDCLRSVVASTGDQQAAEDLVAEAFARALAGWRSVSRHPAPQAWVVRTALNLNVSWWRRRRREAVLTDRDVPPGGTSVQAHQQEPADDAMDPSVLAALRRLPERQRQVVALRLVMDLDTAQTAEALGIAPGTVKAHLARAVSALRAELSPTHHQESIR
jgi:RNA polymerase sigma-70 factor (ECF subfamily)